MSVFKKNNAWFVRYRDISGKQREKKAGATKTIALELERKLLSQRDRSKIFGYDEIEQITFAELAEKYQDYSKTRKRPNTLISQNNSMRSLVPAFGNLFLQEINTKKIDDYIKDRAKYVANLSINRELSFLKSALNKAVEWNYLAKKPAIKLLKEPPPRVRYLSKEEYQNLLESASTDYTKKAIQFAVMTGMRKTEILSLEWSDIDIPNRIIHINDSKMNERRDLPISDELLKVLNNFGVGEGKIFNKGNFIRSFVCSVKRAE